MHLPSQQQNEMKIPLKDFRSSYVELHAGCEHRSLLAAMVIGRRHNWPVRM
jgi:hypothetical protein